MYERDPSYRNSDVYSVMYPDLERLAAIGRREEPTPEGVEAGSTDDARRRRLPFLLCEYAHAMGAGPGSLADYQRILESSDRFCGAFVWEWVDHGFNAYDADGRTLRPARRRRRLPSQRRSATASTASSRRTGRRGRVSPSSSRWWLRSRSMSTPPPGP